MKKLSLMILLFAFGAFMIAGCPEANTTNTTGSDDECTTECGDDAEDGENGEATENGDDTTEE